MVERSDREQVAEVDGFYNSLEAQPKEIAVHDGHEEQVAASHDRKTESTSSPSQSLPHERVEPANNSDSIAEPISRVPDTNLRILKPQPESDQKLDRAAHVTKHSSLPRISRSSSEASSTTEVYRAPNYESEGLKKSFSNPVRDFFLSFRVNEPPSSSDTRFGSTNDAVTSERQKEVDSSTRSVRSGTSRPNSHVETSKTELEAKDMEIEKLRALNATLTSQLRKLEESCEKSDREQVEMAGSLIRLKVDNEELRDHQESFKSQVSQLKAAIDKAPEAAEALLKDEMSRLMRRNEEVHGNNQELEIQMAEMEKELIKAKVQYAEVSSTV